MSKVNLHEFKNKNFKASVDEAMLYLKEHPNSTLVIDPGTYVLTTDLAKEAQENVMSGRYGTNPQPIMFNPNYVYSRGFDFDGHKGTRIEAYGVTIIVDGFMETFSIRNCSNVEIYGLTLDTLRKPFSQGVISKVINGKVVISFADKYPIRNGMPYMRSVLCNMDEKRFDKEISLSEMSVIDDHNAEFVSKGISENDIGKRVYIWHTFHSRPAFLINEAKNTTLKDVTVHSHPGMAITAMHATNITLNRLKVVPSAGEFMSTNTDAVHIASCRGKLNLESSLFVGMGDDTLNCHTYYHDIIEVNGNVVKTKVTAPDGTHAQLVDYFEKGDTLQLISSTTLAELDTFKVISVDVEPENAIVTTTLDHEIVCEKDNCLIADKSALPEVTVANCTMKNHFARGLLLKANKVTVSNCIMQNLFDQGIKIDPEAGWKEGIATTEVTIDGCRILNCGTQSKLCGGLWVYSTCKNPSENIHGKITLMNSIIDCPNSEHALFLKNAKEIVLDSNSISSKGDILKV